MSDGFDIDLGGLQLADDLEVGAYGIEDPEAYQDQTAPPPPPEGNIQFVVTEFKQATEFGTDVPLVGAGKWPVFSIRRIEILAPEPLAGRVVLLNQNLRTQPSDRAGAKGVSKASQFQDFIRTFDALRAWRGIAGEGDGQFPTGLQLVKEFIELRTSGRARGAWTAFDKDYANQHIDAAGGKDQISREAFGKIMGKARIQGMRKFPFINGRYVSEIEGPSGNVLRAKYKLTTFYPSTDTKVKI